ncbi:hypothetical protein ACSBR1_005989 [Camellia fascicularis]
MVMAKGLSVYLESGCGDKLSSPVKQYIQNLLKATTSVETQKASTYGINGRGPIVVFVQYRFTVEEEIPVLYVYESQLGPHVQRKGLGKFLMQLIELIAHKNQMGAVVLTVQKENLLAMNFYMSKLRYTISTISPSRADPLMGLEKSYEILCKAFDHEAKAILEAFLGWLNTSFPSNSGAGLRRKNALLVIAHPDDESMFFTPTINYLTSRGHNLHIMCSSTGSTPTSEDPGPSRFAGWFWQSMEL